MNVHTSDVSLSEIECDLLAVGIGEDLDAELAPLDAHFDGHLARLVADRKFTGKEDAALRLPTLGRIAARELVLVGVKDRKLARLQEAAGRAGQEARAAQAREVVLALGELTADQVGVVIEAVAAGNYLWERYKPEDKHTPGLAELTLHQPGSDLVEPARRAAARARWQAFARDLVNAPAADIYPDTLAERARELEQLDGVSVEVWDLDRCEQEGCVGILAVGSGSSRPGCLIHVRYRPEQADGHVALVGKGVTFDAGGLSLKPSASMQTMRCDMAGSATVLGAIAAVADLGLLVAVDAFVGAVENMTGPAAYKLGDILRYPNGVTVEIHNTDAEGRLVLADCLIQASKVEGVTHVLDLATLTGACVVALGSDYTGLFTEDDELASELLAAAEANGEGLWRLPLHGPYGQMLKSDYAQIKNVGGRAAGATTAALFLQHFVDGPRWAHLDIAGPSFMDKKNGYYAPGGTGQMVRTLASWIAGLAG